MKIIITENQLKELINEGGKSGSHSTKDYDKLIKWAKNYLNIKVTERNNKHVICPPEGITKECYISHPNDNALYEVMRYFAKIFDTNKKTIEDCFKSGRSLPKE
jgi:hypothetical protein